MIKSLVASIAIISLSVPFAQAQNIRSYSASGAEAFAVGGSSGGRPLGNTPDAIAPSFGSANPCMGAFTAGASGPFAGLSFGKTYPDEDCRMRSYIAITASLAAMPRFNYVYPALARATLVLLCEARPDLERLDPQLCYANYAAPRWHRVYGGWQWANTNIYGTYINGKWVQGDPR
jgi:hypothetical protein